MRLIIFLFVLINISCNSKVDNKTVEEKKIVKDNFKINSIDYNIKPNQESKKQRNCHLPIDHPAHSDPYYNGHLHENFNPQQKDFSKEFFELRTQDSNNFKNQISSLDCSNVWSKESLKNGIIGLNYRTINIEYEKVQKINKYKYSILGKSRVKKNICDFEGYLMIKHVHLYENSDVLDIKQGKIIGSYELKENPKQKHSGVFKGTFESYFYFESDSIIKLDNLFDGADGYHNNSFVGTWESYNNSKIKKCIWGDYRLPFTFDYDVGDGEMIINEKYREN